MTGVGMDKKCKHCWHTEGGTSTSGSNTIYTYSICCHCGEKRTEVLKPKVPDGHGKYYPV